MMKKNSKTLKIKKLLWLFFIGGILSAVLLVSVLSFQDLPSFDELENPKSNQATEILANNGAVMGRLYVENRVDIDYQDLNPHLINALIATEDVRFGQHSGIDFRALLRVLVKTLFLQNKNAGGGSTITQQLAKLLYSDRDFTGMNRIEKAYALLSRKVKEWITAVKLERAYTKEEILTMYLNKFNFINGAYGIEAASEIYFNKNQKDLKVEEAALLIGMLKNPSLYNPMRRPELTIERRNTVLYQMNRYGKLDEITKDSLQLINIDKSHFKKRSHETGLAPYFRQVIANEVKEILSRDEIPKPNGKAYDIYRDGLKIYTTIDTTIQRLAEISVLKHMPKVQSKFWKVWSKQDPWTYKDYETSEEELKIRSNSLEKLIKQSERYQNIMIVNTANEINTLNEKLKISIKDYEIRRIIEHEDGVMSLSTLEKKGFLSSQSRKKYQQIMACDAWPKLKTAWVKAEKLADKSMRKPVKMRVFTYENEKMEKDTSMSPLDSIKYHRMFLQMGSMAIDPLTGHVKAWVGGVNFKYFQYDHVTAQRQVGSTFKPFVYATAIGQQALSPCFEVYDIPYTIHTGESGFDILEDWTPKNADGEYTGDKFTLKEGLKKSKNTVSVYLTKQLGSVDAIRGLVDRMGIDSSIQYPNGRYYVPKQPSICLGAADLTVAEMTGAYATFANNGIYNKPIYISRMEDKNGKLIYQSIPESNIALDAKTNYVMVEMLRNVVYGAGGFHGRKSDFGGKTGTTDKHVDGWFIGITPNLVVGTWVGGEDPWIRFLSLAQGQGSRMARPYFAAFLEELEQLDSTQFDAKKRFYRPPGDLGIITDCEDYFQVDSSNIKKVDVFDQIINDGNTPGNNEEEFGGDFQ